MSKHAPTTSLPAGVRRSLVQLLLPFLLSAPAISAPGADSDYIFASWTTVNGLPQNSVMAILQTREGYLWLATFDGLVRYDGIRFQVFDKASTAGFLSNRCMTLSEDREGNLWIGTEEGILIRHFRGTFQSYRLPNELFPALIQKIRAEGPGGLSILTTRGQVRWQGDRFVLVPEGTRQDKRRFGHVVRSGDFWYADDSGLHRLKQGKVTTYTLRDGLSSLDIQNVFEDRAGDIWVVTYEPRVNHLSNGSWSVLGPKEGLQASVIRAILDDREGNLWFGAQAGGLYRYRNGRLQRYTTANGLSSNDIHSLFEDREGNIWIGTLIGGLNRASKRIVRVLTERDGLTSNVVYPIYQDRKGSIWIGTRGLDEYKDGVVRRYPNGVTNSGLGVTALGEDRDGRLWVGAVGGFGWLHHGRFRILESRQSLEVSSIVQDRSGRLWFGTNRGLIERNGDRSRLYTVRDGLSGNEVKVLYEGRRGELWIGTFGGLSRFENGRIASYTERDGLGSTHVRALLDDGDGALWIGTYDGGLTRLKDGKFTRYTSRDGLYSNGVFQVLDDGRGNFWMSCNRGIFRVSKHQLNDYAEGKILSIDSVFYGSKDGLINPECNGARQPAGIRAQDGRLWFPTQGGAAIVEPQGVEINKHPPPVLIENCVLDGAPVPFSSTLRVPPGHENLEIHYTGLSFINPERVTFKYRLEGVDRDWVNAGTRRTAYYSHFLPGNYSFTVLAANSDGVWNTNGAGIEVIVIPPFWRTWWFYSAAFLCAAALGTLAYQRRLRQLTREHAAQRVFSQKLIESQETERKRIASALHDSLGQSLLIIKNRALLGAGESDQSESSLEQFNEISSVSSQALEEVREIAHDLRPFLIDRLGLTAAIQSMLDNVSDSSGIELTCDIDTMDGLIAKDFEINLYRILQECVNNIVKHSEADRASVCVKVKDRSLQVSVQDNGKGFPAEEFLSGAGNRPIFGLAAIGERVRINQGRYSIRSQPGGGTLIAMEFDLRKVGDEK